jgi:hypothetical protein
MYYTEQRELVLENASYIICIKYTCAGAKLVALFIIKVCMLQLV